MRAMAAPATQRLRVLFGAYAGGPLPQFDEVAASIAELSLPPRRTVISAGNAHPHVYLVLNGLVKVVCRSPDGVARTLSFADEDAFVYSLSGLGMAGLRRLRERELEMGPKALADAASGVACTETITVEASRLLAVPYTTIERLSFRYPQWGQVLVTFLSASVASLQQSLYSQRYERPEQRYARLLSDRPGLVERVTQRDLASYLGVTPAALSRIAARVRTADLPVPSSHSPTAARGTW